MYGIIFYEQWNKQHFIKKIIIKIVGAERDHMLRGTTDITCGRLCSTG